MAADDEIKVKISADAEEFKTGADSAASTLQSSMDKMKSGVESAGSGIKESISSAAGATKTAADEMQSSMGGAMSRISSSIAGMKNAIGAAAIGIVAVFGSSAHAAIDYEKSLLGLSRTTGLTIEQTSELAFAASQCGLTADSLTRNIGFLSRNMSSAEASSDGSTNAFKKYNIALKDSHDKALPVNQVLSTIADRFKSMPDGPTKTALAMQLFGRQGREMIPFLNQGAAGIDKLNQKAKQMGLTFNNVNALKTYVAAQRQWSATMQSLQVQIGNAVLPVLTAFSKAITNLLQTFNRLNPEFRQTVITVAAVAASVAALTLGWGAAAAAIAAFGGPFASVGTAMTNFPNIITACTTGLKSFVVGLAEGTINMVKYIASGQAFSAAHRAMTTAMAAARAAMAATRTTIVAVSVAYQVGGVKSIASYCASLVSMRSIIGIARVALIALYATVTAGIAVVVALAAAWAGNFGNIQEATAGTCDGIIYGLNNFADGISQIMSGIGKIFTSLATTIGNALVGDFSGAIESAKGMLEGVKSVGAGAWGAMKGIGQTIYGAASDPSGALNFMKAAGGSLLSSGKKLFGIGDDGGSSEDGSTDNASSDDTGGGGGGGGGGGNGGGSGDSEYEKQKKLYEQQLQLAEYTAKEKEELYRTYLENVAKSDKEAIDYKIGLYQVEKEAFVEHLKDQELDLENDHTRGTISEETYQSDLARIKTENLRAEVEFRAKAAMAADNITEEDKAKQIDAYKKKIEASTWYKGALKEVLDAQKSLADYELSVNNKIREYDNNRLLSSLSLEEKRQEGLYNLGVITEEQLLAMQKNFENQRYAIQSEAAVKELADGAINTDKMLTLYQKYHDARTRMDQETYFHAMLMNSKNEEGTISALKSLQDLQSNYAEKMEELHQKELESWNKDLKSLESSMSESLSSAMQDVVKGTKSLLEGLRSFVSSTLSSIIKMITDRLSSTILQNAFSKLFKTEDKTQKTGADSAVVASEVATQAARTAAAQAGSTQRTVIEQTGGQMQVTATEQKAATQIGVETTKDATIVASSTAAASTSVAATQASITSMLQMLPVLLIVSALSGLLGGSSESTTTKTDGPGINLGRNPDSYYKTPTLTGIPSYDVGSWSLPSDTLAMVHKEELIVPSKGGQADNVRNLLSSGGGQQAPQINLSYSAVHTGRTNADVRMEMKDNAKYMVKVLDTEYRKFNRGAKK